MKQEYIGSGSVALSKDRDNPVYLAVFMDEGATLPTRKSLFGAGLDLVRVYEGVNFEAYRTVNEAANRATRGERIDFESILEEGKTHG